MKTLKQYINESLDRPERWKWIKQQDDFMMAAFDTEQDSYRVRFNAVIPEYWEVSFSTETGRPSDTTGKHEALKVLSTVLDIILNFLEDPPEKLEKLLFSANRGNIDRASAYERIVKRKLPNRGNIDRASAYERIVKRKLPDEFKVEVTDTRQTVFYQIERK